MATEPIYDRFTERLYRGLPDCYREADADNEYALKHYLSGICDELRKVMDLYQRIDFDIETEGGAVGGSSDLLNPNAADSFWLRWIAQMLGISIEAYRDIVKMRGAIIPTFTKHTIAGLERVAANYLYGQKRVRVVLGKEEDEISFVVHPDDVYGNALSLAQATMQVAELEPLDSTALSANMLFYDQATFEGANEWEILTGSIAPLTLDVANFYEGTKALKVEVTGNGAAEVSTPLIPLAMVVPSGGWDNRTFTATVAAKTNGAQGYRLYMRWYNALGTYMSQTVSDTNFDHTGIWTEKQIQSVAPAGCAQVRLVVGKPAATTGDIVYVDQAGAWRGQGGVWTVDGADLTFRPNLQEYPYSKDPVVGWLNTPEGVAYRAAFGNNAGDTDFIAFSKVYNETGTIAWAAKDGAFDKWLVPVLDKFDAEFGDRVLIGVKYLIPETANFVYGGPNLVVRWFDAMDVQIGSVSTPDETKVLNPATQWTTMSRDLVPPVGAVSVSVDLSWDAFIPTPTRIYFAEAEVIKHYTGVYNGWANPLDNFDIVKIVKEADFWHPRFTYVAYRHVFDWTSIEQWSDFIGTQVAVADGEPVFVNDWNAFTVQSGFLNSLDFDVI